MQNRYHDLNTYLRNRFGCRVQKISIDAGMSCPNRDGTLSSRGCIYCNRLGSGTGAFHRGVSIADQIREGKKSLSARYKAKKFIAYFQSFTNTYAPVAELKRIYDEALGIEDVVGISVGTRPDCIDEEKLTLFENYAKKYLVWIEYGLQSVHDETLARINRGHDFKAFKTAVEATKNRGIKICVHVILGLPGESRQQMIETAKTLAKTGIDGLKVHLLYVVKGTPLEEWVREGRYTCLTQKEYVDTVCEFLAHTPENVVIQRLTGDPHPQEVVAPQWALNKAKTLNLIRRTLEERNLHQGMYVKT